jgi:UPF0716 protein FxsA
VIVKRQGSGAIRRIREELATGRVPSAALVDGGLISAAGVLLVLPGFVTDVVGFGLLVPPVRTGVRRSLGRRFTVQVPTRTRRWVPSSSPPTRRSVPPPPPGEWVPPREPPAIDV